MECYLIEVNRPETRELTKWCHKGLNVTSLWCHACVMNITRHVELLQNQLTIAAAAGDDTSRDVAARLVAALEPAARVAILDVLTESSAELTSVIAPASIDVRLRGRDVDFIVEGLSGADAEADTSGAEFGPDGGGPGPDGEIGHEEEGGLEFEGESTSRTTLRLPDSIKARAEKTAKSEGISLNAWLVRAIAGGLEPRGATTRQRSNKISGWMR